MNGHEDEIRVTVGTFISMNGTSNDLLGNGS